MSTSNVLVWDAEETRLYETGVDRGVLFVHNGSSYGTGVAWNGLTAVNESPSGAEPTALWADNKKYITLTSAEEFAATIEAYTYPDKFAECDGSSCYGYGALSIGQQTRKKFGFSYRTLVGNDAKGNDYGYKIHIVYGAHAKPSSRDHATVNDSPEAATMSWEISTDPVSISGEDYKDLKPTAHIVIDSTKCNDGTDSNGTHTEGTLEAALKWLEGQLYGTDAVNGSGGNESTLPSIESILQHFNP